ncbi:MULTISPECIES: hypothetical protein [unclassified Cupriavidus]|uniref:hypothetical protein n=1 Tax=Cupriavidus sp. H19C3 TaxID=3241603 RepID=UPI003BF86854
MALDLKATSEQFLDGISSAVTRTAKQGLDTIEGFSQRQVQSLARQSALVAGMLEANMFTNAERDFHLEGLKDMATSFVDTLAQLITITIQKVWNAVVKVIWNTINELAGTVLSIPKFG